MGSSRTLVAEVEALLEGEGPLGALRFLNARAPHRFTGIYRYDASMLRNEYLVDSFDRDVQHGDDIPMEEAYCTLVRERGEDITFRDARTDPRVAHRPGTSVVSYCGALIRDGEGRPFGTLCHFDVKPCDAPAHDLELLGACAPLFFSRLASPGR